MRLLHLATLVSVLSAIPAVAQEQGHTQSGKEVRLGWIGSVGSDCKPVEPQAVTPAKLAQHGQIRLVRGTVTTEKIAQCPSLSVPAIVVFYTSSPDFKGVDSFALKAGDGAERTYTVTVE
ncbi:hypothetical protein [Aureimonas psammosilenae]|uniref:hypothetical protein n=1 Tax=Aureimonas psammosilenae TaxID=2495496 RepID=UPI001260B378|nr:hypothetical protein [Aureimonas psammosilenae]